MPVAPMKRGVFELEAEDSRDEEEELSAASGDVLSYKDVVSSDSERSTRLEKRKDQREDGSPCCRPKYNRLGVVVDVCIARVLGQLSRSRSRCDCRSSSVDGSGGSSCRAGSVEVSIKETTSSALQPSTHLVPSLLLPLLVAPPIPLTCELLPAPTILALCYIISTSRIPTFAAARLSRLARCGASLVGRRRLRRD